MGAQLPTGTLTLLFSDVEGSTSMVTRLGPQWGEALSVHRAILRGAFEEFDGHELTTEGDSFFVVFSSALQGLQAAITAQRRMADHEWPGGARLRVRMGLHTGEPQRHEDGYIGLDVHRAARIMAAGSGGQIVLSDATATLVTGQLPEVELRDLGWHRLKDIPEPEHLYDVAGQGLPVEHPPLRSLGALTRLPSYPTELVGRGADLEELAATLAGGSRLVTMTGPGGTGKTRLAVAVAGRLQHAFPHGIFFVPLHTADRGALLWAGIAEVVGAPAEAQEPPEERVLRVLQDRSMLLVLDNLEQIPDADQVVSTLLSETGVSLLCTSRSPLHLLDERLYPVSTLPVIGPAAGAEEQGRRGAAVDLFVQRAQMVRPGFVLDDDNEADVVALCQRLDGLPLAIELAAARCRLLSPRAVLQRIGDWLAEGPTAADRPERHRTLAATIAWSYDLLDEPGRMVFRRLGGFSSRVGLDAVEQVVGPGTDPLEAVAHLVDVSLLDVVEGPDGEPMVVMLDTVRRFARDRLAESGEIGEVRLRHARWCDTVVTAISELISGPRQMAALDRMEAVEEDARAALDWALSLDVGDGTPAGERRDLGFSLLRSMFAFWYRFGYVAEARDWHDRALRLIDGADVDDDPAILDALHGLGVVAVQQGDFEAGASALERALAMAQRLGDVSREARECNSLGVARRVVGRTQEGRQLIERSLDLSYRIGNPSRIATALTNLVHAHMDAEEYDWAVETARRAVAVDEENGDRWGVAINRINLVSAILHAQGPRPALELLVTVAPDVLALGDVELSIDTVETVACVWAALGDAERAAAITGAAESRRDATGIPRPPSDEILLHRFVDPVRKRVSAEQWEAAYRRGRALTLEQAVEEGCDIAPLPSDPAMAGGPAMATRRADPSG